MAELPQEPSIRELLERVASLAAQNVRLAARVDDLEKRADNSHKFMMKLIDQIGGIDEQVLELMEKVFPGHARTQLQIIEILKSPDTAE